MFSLRSRKSFHDKFLDTDDPILTDPLDEKYIKKPYLNLSYLSDQFSLYLLTAASLYLRVLKLDHPPFVTEIELELTRQTNWYMAGQFFIGKFPPFVGILCTILSRLAGYYGTENLIYPGQPLGEFPLVVLRRMSALIGSLLIPLAYMTLRNLGQSRLTANIAAVLLVFENGMVTQSRYASPEIYVLFFSAFSVFSWSLTYKYLQESKYYLTTRSGLWQIITGIGMGCALSTKWTGASVFIVIWTTIIINTWNRLCETKHSVKKTLNHVFIHSFTVGLLPIIVYIAIFQLHFTLIPKSGDHDLLLTPELKYSLVGNELEPSQANIAFGSQVVIRHLGTVGGYLHSHKKRYSGGSKQQEVTLYPHIDINNIWTVHRINRIWNTSIPLEYVHNMDQIRLEHFPSSRKLHSHNHRPQITNKKEHSEVTAYGDRLIQDANDYWILQILNEKGRPINDSSIIWQPLIQKFRLKHIRGCTLMSHHVFHMGKAGTNQQEVTCMNSAGRHVNTWMVEASYHEQLENHEMIQIQPINLKSRFFQVHELMYRYRDIMYDRLSAQTKPSPEGPHDWFFKKTNQPIWTLLSGYSSQFILNRFTQRLILLSSTLLTLTSLFRSLSSQRHQTRSSPDPNWLYLLTFLIQLESIRIFPDLSILDITGPVYYGIAFASTVLRRRIWLVVCLGSIGHFLAYRHLAYGDLWNGPDCERSGYDCPDYPGLNRTVNFWLPPGRQASLRVTAGREVWADREMAVLRHRAYLKEAVGIRFHRVLPTPPISPDQAAAWAGQVYQAAVKRNLQKALKSAEENRLAGPEAEKEYQEMKDLVERAQEEVRLHNLKKNKVRSSV